LRNCRNLSSREGMFRDPYSVTALAKEKFCRNRAQLTVAANLTARPVQQLQVLRHSHRQEPLVARSSLGRLFANGFTFRFQCNRLQPARVWPVLAYSLCGGDAADFRSLLQVGNRPIFCQNRVCGCLAEPLLISAPRHIPITSWTRA